MGKLHESLTAAVGFVQGIEKSARETAAKLSTLVESGQLWLESSGHANSQLYAYMNEKLKLEKKKYKDVEGDAISAHADSKVVGFLQEITQMQKQASDFRTNWEKLGESLEADLARGATVLAEIDKTIAKKKKKLLQSKKYKTKIAGYEKLVGDLRARIQKVTDTIHALRTDNTKKPPSQQQVALALGLKPSSTLKQLEDSATSRFQSLYNEYQSGWKAGKIIVDGLKKQEFSKEITSLKAMISEAKDIEAEAPE